MVQNATARHITKSKNREDVTPISALLPVSFRTDFKIIMTTYEPHSCLVVKYTADVCEHSQSFRSW